MSNNIDIIVNAIDKATKTLKAVQGEVQRMAKEVDKSGKSFQEYFKKNEAGFRTLQV